MMYIKILCILFKILVGTIGQWKIIECILLILVNILKKVNSKFNVKICYKLKFLLNNILVYLICDERSQNGGFFWKIQIGKVNNKVFGEKEIFYILNQVVVQLVCRKVKIY